MIEFQMSGFQNALAFGYLNEKFLSIICLNCSRLRASDCLLSSITVLLERRFLLGDGVCCEDELDDLFSRSFLLDIRGCRVYRQILASMFHYQDIRIQK